MQPSSPTSGPRAPWIALFLLASTLALYAPTFAFEFLNYDDDAYVTANEGVRGGLSWEGVRWAFTSGHAANWHPLTWLSHQLDVELFGLDPGAHHRTSAVLHALAAALLFLALDALTRARVPSALVAAFFAWHPLRVESVAWVAERKDVLAGVFAFACLAAYAQHARHGGALRYALALSFFALGLLAKPVLVPLPFLLLVLDAWPLGRLGTSPSQRARRLAALAREKLPFFALAVASSLVTLRVQRAGGALGPLERIDLGARLANALAAPWTYAWKTLWPTGSNVMHLHPALAHPERSPWTPAVLAAIVWLVATSLVLVRLRRRAPFALAGWLWFLGLLVPVIGLVQVGLQGWAERYGYLATVGLGILLVFAMDALARSPTRRRVAALAAGVALAGLALQTRSWMAAWRDSESLFEQSLAQSETVVAHVNLAKVFEERGELARAETHLARALALDPGLVGARLSLARVLRAGGRAEEARAELERAVSGDPTSALAATELGWILAELGRDAEALPHLRRAVALDSTKPALWNNLAWVLATSRTHSAPEEARKLAEGLCQLTRGAQAAYLETHAAALARLGRHEEAVALQQRALQRVPAQHRTRLAERLELYRSGQALLWP